MKSLLQSTLLVYMQRICNFFLVLEHLDDGISSQGHIILITKSPAITMGQIDEFFVRKQV